MFANASGASITPHCSPTSPLNAMRSRFTVPFRVSYSVKDAFLVAQRKTVLAAAGGYFWLHGKSGLELGVFAL